MTGGHFRRTSAALAAGLVFLTPVAAAELPTQARDRPIAKRGAEPPKGLPRCDVGGVEGAMSPSGVCLKLSGFVSAGFYARQIK